MKKRVIRVGDVVRIKEPIMVQRVGYPWTLDYVKKNKISEPQKNDIERLLLSVSRRSWPNGVLRNIRDSKEFNKILNILAHCILKNNDFGGKERCIWAETVEKYKGKLAKVVGKHIAKTGLYCPPSNSFDYYNGGYEYEPAGLSNEQTHVILHLEIYTDDGCWSHFSEFATDGEFFKYHIDACNVELHKQEPRWRVDVINPNKKRTYLGTYSGLNIKEIERLIQLNHWEPLRKGFFKMEDLRIRKASK